MNEADATLPIDALLRERVWVRALARSLVRSEPDADDLEQDVWVDALASAPRETTSPRGWLATVIYRRASRGRRAVARARRREAVAARPEATPAAADLVAVAEQHRRLMGFVLELAEPVRSAVLARYVEGLPPREIATRSGESVKTVKSRIARGLEQLRKRLDADSGGERQKWLAAFAPIGGASEGPVNAESASASGTATTAASIASGGLFMATKAKAVVASVSALLVGGAIWLAVRPGETDAPPDGRAVSAVAANAGDTSLASPPRQLDMGSADAGMQSPESATGRASVVVRVRVVERVDAAERLVSGATVLVSTSVGTFARGTTGAAGEPAGIDVAPEAAAVVWAWADGFALARMERPAGIGSNLHVALAKGKPVTVAFVSAAEPTRVFTTAEVRARFGDAPAVAATLVPAAEFNTSTPADMLRRLTTEPATWSVSGEIPLGGEEPRLFADVEGSQGLVLVSRPGDEPYLAWIEPSESRSLRVTVPLRETVPTVRVRVEAAESGDAVPGAVFTPYAEAGDDALFVRGLARTADARGELELPRAGTPARSTRSATWWVTAPGRAGVVDSFELAGAGNGSLTVRLALTATAKGHAWLGSGAPAAGRMVLSGWKGRYASARVEPDGTFILAGVALRDLRIAGEAIAMRAADAAARDHDHATEGEALLLLVEDVATAAISTANVRVRAGETADVTLGKPASGDAAVVRGRVTAGGRPLGGLQLGLRAISGGAKRMGVTDVDGRFRLESLTPGTYDFALFLGEPGIVDDVKLRSTASLSLGAGDDRELSFDLPSGRLRVRLVDDKTGAAEAGAIAFAVPKDSTRERGRFAGFEFFPGWVATTDFEGRAVLLGLPVGLPHILEAGTKDRRLKGGVAESLPVTDPAGAEIVIRLK